MGIFFDSMKPGWCTIHCSDVSRVCDTRLKWLHLSNFNNESRLIHQSTHHQIMFHAGADWERRRQRTRCHNYQQIMIYLKLRASVSVGLSNRMRKLHIYTRKSVSIVVHWGRSNFRIRWRVWESFSSAIAICTSEFGRSLLRWLDGNFVNAAQYLDRRPHSETAQCTTIQDWNWMCVTMEYRCVHLLSFHTRIQGVWNVNSSVGAVYHNLKILLIQTKSRVNQLKHCMSLEQGR